MPREARRYTLRDGVLWYGKKADAALMVPPPSEWRGLVEKAHCVAHSGAEKVCQLLRNEYFWPRMFEMVRLIIQKCDLCERVNHGPTEKKTVRPVVPRSALEVFDEVWMDLIGEVPVSARGNRYLLVMTDSRTRYAVAVPLRSKTAEESSER